MEITEDYVSFEIAKLLKEKGFNAKCSTYYASDDEIAGLPITRDFNNHGIYLSAPTLQTAMKWLREEKNLYIYIEPVELCLSEGKILTDNEDIRSATELELQLGFRYNIINSNNYSEDDVLSGSYIGDFIKYEDAVEAALKYSLSEKINL
jgi:hypothetical protein